MKTKIKLSREDKIYYTVMTTIVTIFMLVVLYPMIYFLSCSFSAGDALLKGEVILLPIRFNIEGYKAVFQYKNFLSSFGNSIIYTVVGTFINIVMTLVCAYPLARKDLPGRGYFTLFFTFTMFISGGTIPNYLLVKSLGMLDTRWALLIPGAVSVYNMLIVRNFIQSSIPGGLQDAAQIDGCSDLKYLFEIILPLSKASIAVIALYYAVGHWNSYFNAMLYLYDRSLVPLQTILREILVMNEVDPEMLAETSVAFVEQQQLSAQLKYALIVVSAVPMICIYPFVQKYFVKGVMVGSIKG